jgi:hypothetical protein
MQEAARAADEALVTGDWAAAKEALGKAIGDTIKSLLSSIFASFGPLGGLLGSFAGGVIDGLVKKLFGKGKKVEVENTIKAEIVKFPTDLGLDFASNPASRLFGERAVPRGAPFIQIEMLGDAAQLFAAKVAGQLNGMNALQGVR